MIINKMIGHSVCLVKRSKIFTGHVLHVRLSADGILGAVKQSCWLPWHIFPFLCHISAEWWLLWVVQLFVDCSGTHGLLKSSKNSCMGSCTILLEPLFLPNHTTTSKKCLPELVKNNNVMLFIDRNCLSNIILKPKQSDYAMFQYGNSCSGLHRVQCSLKDFIWCLSSPKHRVLAADIAW